MNIQKTDSPMYMES